MRTYFEASEVISGDFLIEPDFVRAEVTDKTATEEADILTCIRDIMFGKEYRLIKHFCGHEEGKGCIMREI